jgi:hypothetical protein
MKVLIVISFYLLCLNGGSFGQDFGKALQNFAVALEKPFSASIEIKIMDGNHHLETITGNIAKNGNLYYSSIQGITLVNTRDLSIIISKHNQNIEISESLKINNLPNLNNQEWAKTNGTRWLGDKNNATGFLLPSDEYFSSTEIWFDKNTGMLQKVIYTMDNYVGDEGDKWSRMEITYKTDWSKPNTEYFNLKKYILSKAGGYYVTQAYHNYTLIDLTGSK